MKYAPFFRCKDRFQIYTLLAARCVVDGYEWEGNSVYFRFEDKKKCEAVLNGVLSKHLKVYAHDFIEAIRTAQTIFNN